MQERAEWINSIIQQLWPNVGHYTRKIINDTVEAEVKKALNIYNLTGFKFEKVVLGKKKNRKTSKISLNHSNFSMQACNKGQKSGGAGSTGWG